MENNIVIKVLEKSDIDKTTECLARGFLREPMVEALNADYEDMFSFCKYAVPKASETGLSVIAKDTLTDDVVAVCLNKDLLDSPIDDNAEVSEKLFPIFELLDGLEERYLKSNTVKYNEIFHVTMIAVDRNVMNKRLSYELFDASFKTAIERGFTKTLQEATGLISQHIAIDRLGHDEFCSINYSDFIYQNRRVFEGIKSVPSCKLLTKNL